MTIDVDGQQLYVEITGEGPDVMILHGWGCSVATFALASKELSQTHRVINLDFPGFGQSPEPLEPWSVTEYAKLICKAMVKLDIERCDIIGHSFGGRVAILLANSIPERIRRIVLVGSAGIMPKRTFKSKVRVRLYKLCKSLAKHKAVAGALKGVGIDVQKRIQNAGSADYRALKSDVMRQTFIRVVNQDLRPYLVNIHRSTLLIWGDLDEETPLYMGRIMEREMKDAGLVVFEGCGHYCFLEQHARFMAIIQNFLGGSN